MKKTVTFGEIMMRLNPEGYMRFVQVNKLDASYGGGEANVAVSLANYGKDASFVTKLPDSVIGQCAVNELRKYGVDTNSIARGGPRLGIYFLEKGASQRASKVIYDRAGSSFATAQAEDFDWESIFNSAEWFHFTGISPAVGKNIAEICLNACKAAKELGLTVSCDLNYRKTLWSKKEAGETMAQLMPYVDVLIANEEDADSVFGIHADNTDIDNGQLDDSAYVDVARKLTERFGIKKVAITLRKSLSASENDWAGMLYEDGIAYFSRQYRIKLVDRVGGGDSFAAGIIYSILSGKAPQQTVEFAVAASCLKQTIEYDFNHASVQEVELLMSGNESGRVQR